MKIHIKKGDTVLVLSGDGAKEKKTGKVLKVIPEQYRAVVEGLNKVKRHVKPTAESPGGIFEKEASIHISNLMLVDANGTASKVKKGKVDGKTVRISKKTQEVI